jgi:hypothetical protein
MSNEHFEGMNEYQKLKKQKSRSRYRKLFDEYDFIIEKEYNNIVTFIHDNTTFYFTEVNGIIREKGSKIRIPLKKFLNGEY